MGLINGIVSALPIEGVVANEVQPLGFKKGSQFIKLLDVKGGKGFELGWFLANFEIIYAQSWGRVR